MKVKIKEVNNQGEMEETQLIEVSELIEDRVKDINYVGDEVENVRELNKRLISVVSELIAIMRERVALSDEDLERIVRRIDLTL